MLNRDRYQKFYITSETTTFQQYSKSIHQLGLLGKQVEIQAASDNYQMPVYVCSPHPTTTQIRWLRFKPSYSPQVRGVARHVSTLPGVIENLASPGIWYPRVIFTREFGIPSGHFASPNRISLGIWNPRKFGIPRVAFPKEFGMPELYFLNNLTSQAVFPREFGIPEPYFLGNLASPSSFSKGIWHLSSSIS